MARSRTECDLLVIGSGAAGMAAAVTARIRGLDVILCEKEALLGGATARSGGWLWIPGNRFMADGDADRATARTYIRHRAGEFFDAARVDAFLRAAPEMARFMETSTNVRFQQVTGFPDYHPDDPGGSQGGRSIIAESYDAFPLGKKRKWVRPPLPVATWAGMMVSVPELDRFQRAGRSLPAALYVARRLLRQARDWLLHGVTMRLANGNALIGRLLETALARGVHIWSNAPAISLLVEHGRVTGALVSRDGEEVEVRARRGVVLASGGFPHDRKRREQLVPWAGSRDEHWMALPAGNTGDGLNMGEAAGALVSDAVRSPVALGPVTPLPTPVGDLPAFPHLGGRAKPGLIAVTMEGRRFTNEADSYHVFGSDLIAASGGGEPSGYIICDSRSLRRYGFGYAKPWPLPVGPYVASGYLKSAQSIAALAGLIGIDAARLGATVSDFNRDARNGEDPGFGRGGNRYNTVQGDREVAPNPCVLPLETGPFYAVRVTAGALGTFAGLATDANARVLARDGSVIDGLYAAGNDMLSVLGGDYVGGGTTLGPAMTFGYLAACHAAGEDGR